MPKPSPLDRRAHRGPPRRTGFPLATPGGFKEIGRGRLPVNQNGERVPKCFLIDTPLGKYNPDWANLKHDDTVLYLVRETKGTTNYERLPHNKEAQKLRCGREHFEALGADYNVVASAEVM